MSVANSPRTALQFEMQLRAYFKLTCKCIIGRVSVQTASYRPVVSRYLWRLSRPGQTAGDKMLGCQLRWVIRCDTCVSYASNSGPHTLTRLQCHSPGWCADAGNISSFRRWCFGNWILFTKTRIFWTIIYLRYLTIFNFINRYTTKISKALEICMAHGPTGQRRTMPMPLTRGQYNKTQ